MQIIAQTKGQRHPISPSLFLHIVGQVTQLKKSGLRWLFSVYFPPLPEVDSDLAPLLDI